MESNVQTIFNLEFDNSPKDIDYSKMTEAER